MQEGSIIVFGAVNARGFYHCLYSKALRTLLFSALIFLTILCMLITEETTAVPDCYE